jgi:amidase
VASDRGLVSATACAVVGKLNSGEVTPLDLLDALEQRIAEVDGKPDIQSMRNDTIAMQS